MEDKFEKSQLTLVSETPKEEVEMRKNKTKID